MRKSLVFAAALCASAMNAFALDAKIDSRSDHSLLLRADGVVMATGLNTYGQLGNGNTVNQSNYVQVSNLANVSAIAAGGDFSLAISNGFVYAWGRG